jgi:hypothetical protein
MPFPPKRDHRIPLAAAAAMTKRYRDEATGAETAQMFPREVIETLLSQPGAFGTRFYFGREAAGGPIRLVAVAVDSQGNDLAGGEIIDFGFPCPPWCSGDNQLNS